MEMNKLLKDIEESCRMVFAQLGSGHSESVYHRAMEVELRKRKIDYESEVVIPILYDGHFVGHGRADIIVDKKIIVELKAINSLGIGERMQLNLYLNCLNYNMGILLNFPQPTKNSISLNKVEMEIMEK